MAKILVLDDEQSVLDMIERALNKEEYEVRLFTSPADGIAEAARFIPDVVITDIKMEELDGFDVLRKVKKINPEINVILITAYASLETAVEAIRGGAFDYLIKPFKIHDLRLAVKRALSEKKIDAGIKKGSASGKEMIGMSRPIQAVKNLIKRVSSTESTVLVCGESGTGKELVARDIHILSSRVSKPFVSINCAALPDSLLESELFGYEKGSFTGAISSKMGLVEYAHTGSLFLDEVGETSQNIQVKLLRVLQEKEIRRVGGLEDIPVDVRIIAATSRDLEEEVKQGAFREDLFYRLNVIPISVPPLRERRGDVKLLVDHFVAMFNRKMNKNFYFTPDGLVLFEKYAWPGNVRELENVIERVLALAEGDEIDKETVARCWGRKKNGGLVSPPMSRDALKRERESVEKELIIKTLQETKGNKLQAAKKLNVSRQNLQYKLRKYDLLG